MIKFYTETKFTRDELLNIPSATLAYIGDAVFSLCAREYELRSYHGKPAKLNKAVTARVNAGAQSQYLEKIADKLDADCADVVRRARNAPSTTKSKNYGIADYKRATGLEALIGYLYLLGDDKRLNEILELIFTD